MWILGCFLKELGNKLERDCHNKVAWQRFAMLGSSVFPLDSQSA
jgi:hypothetical protein